MIIKWKYDIEATTEEIMQVLGLAPYETAPPKYGEVDPVPEKEEKPKKSGKNKPVDVGKMKALRKAGWSMTKIADEMRCSISTVSKHLRE